MIACLCAGIAVTGAAQQQHDTCPPQEWSFSRLDALEREQFVMPDANARNDLALALTACLGHPRPAIRDGIAFEALTTWMRAPTG